MIWTSFDHHTGEKTEAISDPIWVVVPIYDHTLFLNNIIVSIQSGTGKNLNFRKMMKIQQFRTPLPIVVMVQGNVSRFFQFRGE